MIRLWRARFLSSLTPSYLTNLTVLTVFLAAFIGFCPRSSAGSAAPTSVDILPGAHLFVLKAHGARVIGADIGPAAGAPIMIVPGLAADFPYLTPFVNALVKRGCRVFIYNPQGQGGGALASTGPSSTLGMTGLIQTVLDMHAYIRQQTGNQPVTWAGHSMGGMEIRMASLFVPKSEIRALLPLFSPSIKFAKADTENPLLAYERLLNEQIFSDDLINAWTLGAYDWWKLQSATALFVSSQNGLLKGLLGAPHPNTDALRANVAYFIDWKATPEIISDIGRAVFTGPDKSDLLKGWITRDLSDVTVLSFSGDIDGVISSDDVINEAKALGYPNLHFPVGHIGAFYDQLINPKIADLVAKIATGIVTKDTLLTNLESK